MITSSQDSHHKTSDTLTQQSYSSEFDKSLVCSTPIKRSRKTSSVSNVSNTTFKCSDEVDEKEPSPWEQWIMKKASEESISLENKKKTMKEERRKKREEEKLKKNQFECQKVKIDQWIKIKDETFRTEREKKKIEKIQEESRKQDVRLELQNKSVLKVDQWKNTKDDDLKKLKQKRIELENEQKLNQEQKRVLANKKYDEWLAKHRPQSTPPKPRNIFEAPSPGCNAPSYINPKPWNSETSIKHKPIKIMYTSFG